jgi:transposase
MSMKPQAIPEIPAETVRVVRAVFPKGNLYVLLRDTLGSIYQDELFADLYPDRGQPAYAPWRLALVTIFQFMENLTDRQAADAVRSRLDWKYALSLELTDPGFDHTVLSEFRTRLVAQTAEERFLEAVLDLCKERGWLKARGRQRTDSTHILAKVRALNRAECVVETLRHALNVLAVVAPDWLRSQVQPEWLERYGPRASDYRFPSGTDERQQFLGQVGRDGWKLLAAIEADPASHWMLSIPAVDTLQRIWKQDYLPQDAGGTWKASEDRLEAARSLVASQTEYGIDLVGPTAKDHRWQAQEQNGYALTDCLIDWEHEQARCPQGDTSKSWTPTKTGNQEVIKIKFGYATCGGCPVRAQCTQSRQRTLTVRRREAHFALEAARQREQTEEFVELYDQRAGIEGVHAQGVHRMGLRRSRYIGEPRTHLQHVATAAAINMCRLHDWLTGVSPHSTPLSHFERFMKQAA